MFAERFKPSLQVFNGGTNMAQLYIPAFVPIHAIAPKAGTTEVTLKIMAACSGLQGRTPIDSFYTTVTIPYNDIQVSQQTILLPLPTTAGSMVLIVVAMEYITGNTKKYTVTAKAFMPCAVVGGYLSDG